MTSFESGDFNQALVLDAGTSSFRCGYSGDDQPKAHFDSVVGVSYDRGDRSHVGATNVGMEVDDVESSSTSTHSRRSLVGSHHLMSRRTNVEVEKPFDDGLVTKWDQYEELCDFAFRGTLMVDPAEYGVLATEPTYNTPVLREKLCELMFEKFNVPFFFLAKSAVLSAFAMGKPSALIVDSGASGTTVTPVLDGYAVISAMNRSRYGGDMMTQRVYEAITRDTSYDVSPMYGFRKEIVNGTSSTTYFDTSDIRESYHLYNKMKLVEDVKQSLMLVSEQPFDVEKNTSVPALSYELPDGKVISFGAERFSIPEAMFIPSAIDYASNDRDITVLDPTDHPCLHVMAFDSLRKTDTEKRKDIARDIILTGGNSLIKGLQKRFEIEIGCIPMSHRVKVWQPNSATNNIERRFSAWIGGSILSSLGNFQTLWISRKEYLETGAGIINHKCP